MSKSAPRSLPVVPSPPARPAGRGPTFPFACRFGRDETGSVLVFGLILFSLFLVLVGIALDVIRFETERTRAQYTLDRAVLAAADISQTTPAQAVVDDYFAKAGLSRFDPTAVQTQGTYNEWKKVEGRLDVSTDTMFMRLTGVDTLESVAAATAEERIGNVEISMVLDVSGSMDSYAYNPNGTRAGTKISLLRSGASTFVDTMFNNVTGAGTAQGKLSISVVPYHQQVQLTSGFAGYLNLTGEHNQSYCADFFSADYTTTSITRTQALPRTAHADVRSSSSQRTPSFRECFTYSYATLLPFSSSKTTIKSKISALEAEGDTAIDIGAKWGLALLDPAARPILDSMITNGAADNALSGRPFDWDYEDTMKIMVLMTDGENTNTYALLSPYRSGNSPMWWYKSGNTRYYFYYKDRSGTDYDYYYWNTSNNRGYWYRERDLGSLTRLTWQELWDVYSVKWWGNYYYDNVESGADFEDIAVAHANNTTKDSRLKTVCDAAKAKGVLVFAIAYEATDNGEDALKDCVSADSYYYDAQGSTIADAFAGIANAINMLRLTQ